MYEDEIAGSGSVDMSAAISTDIVLAESFETMQDLLSLVFVDDLVFTAPTVIHGILTPATVIPSMEEINIANIWVVQLNVETTSERFGTLFTGTIEQVDQEDLEDRVAELLVNDFDAEDTTFIIYGEEIPVIHAIDEEYFSDETLSECESIRDIAQALAKEGE
jgi:hypothetical protein